MGWWEVDVWDVVWEEKGGVRRVVGGVAGVQVADRSVAKDTHTHINALESNFAHYGMGCTAASARGASTWLTARRARSSADAAGAATGRLCSRASTRASGALSRL